MEIEESVIRRGRRLRRITPSKISRVTKTLTSLRVKNTFSTKEYSGNSISRLTQSVSEVFHFAASILFVYFFSLGNEQWELPGRFRVC